MSNRQINNVKTQHDDTPSVSTLDSSIKNLNFVVKDQDVNPCSEVWVK